MRTLREGERRLSNRLLQLADHLGVPAVATNPVQHATKMELAERRGAGAILRANWAGNLGAAG